MTSRAVRVPRSVLYGGGAGGVTEDVCAGGQIHGHLTITGGDKALVEPLSPSEDQ